MLLTLPHPVNLYMRMTYYHNFRLYSVSKGAVSLFLKWTDLGSDVHVTAAEVDDTYDVCNQTKVAFNTKIASISVDNSASKVAERVAQKLNADGDPTLPLCNSGV